MSQPSNAPAASEPFAVAPDTFALPAWIPIPGLGSLAMNAFVVRAKEPLLIDTGPGPLAGDFVERLSRVLDPADLRWIWLTHTDFDHIGALEHVLEAAPRARVITSFLGVGKLALHRPLPEGRVHLINPSQGIDLGDRVLRALRPPVFDAPETLAIFDPKSRALFSSDCFGALLAAPCVDAAEPEAPALREGMLTWASIDAPWLEQVGEAALGRSLEAVAALGASHVLGSHLPPAHGMAGELVANLSLAAGRPAFVGPDQAAVVAAAAAG